MCGVIKLRFVKVLDVKLWGLGFSRLKYYYIFNKYGMGML
jgi:hypothetical protein